jgi:hypothetical protein
MLKRGGSRWRGDQVAPWLAPLLLSLAVGCASVDITSTRNPNQLGTIEPVAFVIYQLNTGERYTDPLQRRLLAETQRRGIPARVTIVTGVELDEGAFIKSSAQGMRGLIAIVPVGGTSYNGTLKQILYDVRAFQIDDPTSGKLTKVWRGRANTNSGAFQVQVVGRLELFANDLVARLVRDGVLRDGAAGAAVAAQSPPH